MTGLMVSTIFLAAGTGMCDASGKVETLLRAARSGDTRAMCDLAKAYYHGRGVLKDPYKAKCWVKLAHDRGYKNAEAVWNRLELWKYTGECNLGFDQAVISRRQQGDVFVEPFSGMAFVWVPGRCFQMEGAGKANKTKTRRVCPEGFWMGQYEVTQAQWQAVMSTNPSRFRGDNLPVERVSFEDIKEFIRRLNLETDLVFALPTEVQWEFACRNRGKLLAYPWGEETFRPESNCGGCDAGAFRGRTAPVGSYPPNALGLYDMGGNVREWCRSRMNNGALGQVVRGGSLADPVSSSMCRKRRDTLPGMKTYYTGFRLVLESID